jgi:proton-coupled amino acid transporter
VVTLSLITTFFIAFCVVGNLAWGDRLDTIVLENMPQNTWFTQIIILCYSAAVMLTFPVQFYPAIIILEAKVLSFNFLFLQAHALNFQFIFSLPPLLKII